jgi:raffinose/stachyose/melibiose transport system substrate-binding protein
MKKIITLVLSMAIVITLAACSGSSYDVYIYSNKAETSETLPILIQEWEADYEERTGKDITVKVVAGGDDGGQLLSADLNSKNKPAVFTTRFSELANHIEAGRLVNLETLTGDFKTKLVDTINDAHMLSVDGLAQYGIPENVEGYGFIVNKQVLADILDVTDKDAAFEMMRTATYDEFVDFVEAVTDAIGGTDTTITIDGDSYTIDDANIPTEMNGVFAVMGAENWTYGNHVFNVVYNLEQDTMANATLQTTIEFAGAEAYYDLLTLKVHNLASLDGNPISVGPTFAANYTYDAGTGLIGSGKALFLKQGNWAYGGIAATEGVEEAYLAELAFLPVKIDLDKVDYTKARFENAAEAAFMNESIPVFVPNYYALNAQVSEEELELGMDFLLYLNTSANGVETQVETFSFIPYYGTEAADGTTFEIENSLGTSIVEYMEMDAVYGAPFDGTPSGWMSDDLANYVKEEFMSVSPWGSYQDFITKVIEPATQDFEDAREPE